VSRMYFCALMRVPLIGDEATTHGFLMTLELLHHIVLHLES